MYCTECGTGHADTESVCSKCGVPLLQPSDAAGKIHNYLVPAILTTLCCCVPFGIVAIVYAAGVDGKTATGDFAGAHAASRKAKMWCWISLASGLGFWLLYILAAVIGAAVGAIE